MTAPGAADNPNRRALIILGIGLAALLLFFLVTQVLTGGGDGEEEVTPTATTTSRPGTTPPTAAPGTPGAAPVETFEVFSTKNPFVALRGATGGTTGTAGSGTTGGTGSSTGGTTSGSGTRGGTTGATGGTTGTGGASSGGSTGTSGGGSTEPRRSQRVTLLDVFAEGGVVKANVRVNDRVHKVAAGETFATNFRVLSLSQSTECGRFLFGDDEFRLCRGEELLK